MEDCSCLTDSIEPSIHLPVVSNRHAPVTNPFSQNRRLLYAKEKSARDLNGVCEREVAERVASIGEILL